MTDSKVREPVFNAPAATLMLVAIILIIHALREYVVSEDWRLVMEWGFTPLRLAAQFDAETAAQTAQQLINAGARAANGSLAQIRAALAEYVIEISNDRTQAFATLVTHAGLHGSWAHAIINSVWLVAFGSAINRRMGTARFLLLGVIAAMAGALAQMATDPFSPLPMVGASGAVSGYTGAMARFAFAPGAPLGPWRAPGDLAYFYPAPPISAIFRDQRALIFVGSWFVLNFISGVAAVPLAGADAPIAWVAHMGGFLAGFLLFGFFDRINGGQPLPFDRPDNQQLRH
ncbi:MAG: rhomboid family intramembrane serine protease [Beijerinckiaceae bacterium]